MGSAQSSSVDDDKKKPKVTHRNINNADNVVLNMASITTGNVGHGGGGHNMSGVGIDGGAFDCGAVDCNCGFLFGL